MAPATLVAVKVRLLPSHTGELLLTTGEGGVALTAIDALAGRLEHCPTVTITLYVPASDKLTLLTVGFCKVDVNPLGPVQL